MPAYAGVDVRSDIYLGSWTALPLTGPGSIRNQQVQITRGRQNLKSQLTAAQAMLTLDNRDARWTIRNPNGVWYNAPGQSNGLVQDTPIRFSLPVSLAGLSNYLRLENDLTSYAYTPDGGPGQFVQSASATASAGTSVTVTLPNPTTPGNTLVVCAGGAAVTLNPSVTGVTLGGLAGNFAQTKTAGNTGSDRATVSQWADPNCAGGQTQVTVTFTVTGAFNLCVEVIELAGIVLASPQDKTASQVDDVGAGASWSSGATNPTTQASEVAIGTVCTGAGGVTVTGPAAPWVNQSQVNSAAVNLLTGYDILAATGAVTYSGTFSGNSTYTAIVVTYKAQPASALRITGPIDIRVDLWPSDYQQCVLAAKWGATAKSWLFGMDWSETIGPGPTVALGRPVLAWFDGTNTQFLTANQPLPYYGQRICLRVLFTPSTGTAQFYTAPTMAGSFTQLGTSRVFGATTLSAGAGQPVQVGGGPIAPYSGDANAYSSCLGMIYEAQVLSNVTLEADPVFSSQTAGATSFADSQSNTWTLAGTSEISSRLYRFHGELAALPKSALPNSANAYVAAQAGGMTRRLQQAQSPLRSPMARAYVRLPAKLNLAAYWQAEDASGATQIGSGLGGPAMQIAGKPTLASSSAFACSAALPVMNGATFSGSVPAGATFTDNVCRFLLSVPAAGDTDGSILATMYCSGGPVTYCTLTYHNSSGGALSMEAYGPGGLIHGTGGVVLTNPLNGSPQRISMNLRQNGGNVDMQFEHMPPGASLAGIFTASSIVAGTLGRVGSVTFGSAGITGSAMGHFSVQGTWDSLFDVSGPLVAWYGEPAATRFSRLCSEEGIASRIVGPAYLSVPMGNQALQTLMALLTEIEATDQGRFFEPRETLGLGYITQRALCNQAAMATAAFSQEVDPQFAPSSDDSIVTNDVTVTTASGTSARQVLTSGPMSTAAPPSGIGRFDTSVPVNPAVPGLPFNPVGLDDLAGWYLHVRTADEDRYPQIPFQLARGTQPQAIALLDVGDYLAVTGPLPAWIPPAPIRQIVEGYTETLGPQPLWGIAFTTTPEAPYETAVADSSHAQTPGSSVHQNTASGSGTFLADSVSDLWTTAAGDYPFDLLIAGQQITVSGCSGASSPQTFTVSAWGVNGVTKNLNAGDKILVYKRPYAGLT